jgi:hypothetical protein
MENQKNDSDTENIINEQIITSKPKFDPKEYYQKNKENYKKYYETRKSKTVEIKKNKIKCEICDCLYSFNHKSHHIKTNKHLLNEKLKNELEQKKDINTKFEDLLNILKNKFEEIKNDDDEFYFDNIYCKQKKSN